ncbi:MAG: hypothetical protein PHY30_02515 [Candidatus Pacebacteria bacterium]|nr:hypothetical protein [Candidatus Paceibacterota bacterium]
MQLLLIMRLGVMSIILFIVACCLLWKRRHLEEVFEWEDVSNFVVFVVFAMGGFIIMSSPEVDVVATLYFVIVYGIIGGFVSYNYVRPGVL